MSVEFLCQQCGQQSQSGTMLVADGLQRCMTCTFLTSVPGLVPRQPDEAQLDAEAERQMRLRQMSIMLDSAKTAIAQMNAWPWEGAGSPATALAIQDAAVAAARARNMIENDIVRSERRFPWVPPVRPSALP